MNGQPSLTIAIPVYKRAHAILPLLQELQLQASENDELVVIDDASGDGIEEIVETVPSFRLIQNTNNLGMVGNWNACLQSARNDWICIVHHDDTVLPGALDAMRRACVQAGEPTLIVHWRSDAAIDDRFRYRRTESGPWAVLNVPTIPSGAIVHRDIIRKAGLFDSQWTYSSDLEYFPRICRDFPLMIIESPGVVQYEMHDSNYQFDTWRKPDFESQLEQIQTSIVAYAGITGAAASELVERRMVEMVRHMFKSAVYLDDRSFLKQISRRFISMKGIGYKTRLFATIAAYTGWASKPKTHHLGDRGRASK